MHLICEKGFCDHLQFTGSHLVDWQTRELLRTLEWGEGRGMLALISERVKFLRQDGKRDSRQIYIASHDGGGGGVRSWPGPGQEVQGAWKGGVKCLGRGRGRQAHAIWGEDNGTSGGS